MNIWREAYLVEVDVHALELEVRGTVVPASKLVNNDHNKSAATLQKHLHSGSIETMLA